MEDLEIDVIRDKYIDDLLPAEKQYSIVHLNQDRPPSDPDAAKKRYETDDLKDVAIPPAHLEITVIAYKANGEATILTADAGFSDAQERVCSAIDDLRTDS